MHKIKALLVSNHGSFTKEYWGLKPTIGETILDYDNETDYHVIHVSHNMLQVPDQGPLMASQNDINIYMTLKPVKDPSYSGDITALGWLRYSAK